MPTAPMASSLWCRQVGMQHNAWGAGQLTPCADGCKYARAIDGASVKYARSTPHSMLPHSVRSLSAIRAQVCFKQVVTTGDHQVRLGSGCAGGMSSATSANIHVHLDSERVIMTLTDTPVSVLDNGCWCGELTDRSRGIQLFFETHTLNDIYHLLNEVFRLLLT